MTKRAHVVVLGAAGQLGRQIVARLRAASDWRVTTSDAGDLDICDRESVHAFLAAQRPTFLVNCAALTDLERCEREPELARRINGDAVATLAEAANAIGATLVQLSTDYVFDGSQRRPYSEADEPHPLSVYARSKRLGEQNAGRSRRCLLVRTAWLYGPGGRNFVSTILDRTRAGAPLRIVDDQFGNPSFAPDIAEAIESLMRSRAEGLFHVVNAGSTTWYELACKAVEFAGLSVPIDPVSAEQYGGPVSRPSYSVLDTTRYTEITGHRLRHWSKALHEFVCGHA